MFALLALVGFQSSFDSPPSSSVIADFVVLEELELDSASQPERLFVLRDVTLGDQDPAFGGALTVTGIISPASHLLQRCGDPQLEAVCSNVNTFEVIAVGTSDVLVSTIAVFDDTSHTHRFTLHLPVNGTYRLRVTLEFFDYPGLLENFAFPGWRDQARQLPTLKNSTLLRLKDIVNSPLELQAVVKEWDSGLSTCNLKNFEGFLPGYWKGPKIWKPFACGMSRLYPLPASLTTPFLTNKWIMLVGDSNSRRILELICRRCGKKFSIKPFWMCIGTNFLFSLHIYHPFEPPFSEFLLLTLNETAAKTGVKSTTIPAGLRDKTEPDLVLLSIGTHAQEATGPTISKMVLESLEEVRPTWVQSRKVVLLLTTASCSQKLLALPKLKHMVYFQNNPRINSVNHGSLESFAGKAYVLDFFSTTHPLALLSRSQDPVHFERDVYIQHFVHILHFLSHLFRE